VEAVEDMTKIPTKISPIRRIRVRFDSLLLAALAALILSPAGRAQEVAVQLDPAQTKIEFTLGSTLHTVEGTFKLKGGVIRFDPATGKMSGSIVVDAVSGESGNGGRDRKMHREILESGKYPEIIFTPNEAKGAFNPKGPSKLEVSGKIRLHGEDHDMTVPIDIQPAGPRLRMTMHITIPYIKWGLKNPSTFILRASDKVEIDIHAVGQVLGDEAPH
jgi:polyisoprenoid-binding protein YceI